MISLIKNPYKYKFWIPLAILICSFHFFFLWSFLNQPITKLYTEGGDFVDYVEPVENLVTKGSYFFWEDNYAGRMPGLAFLLYPLRLLTNMNAALNLLLLFQVLFSSIAIYLFALMSYNENKSFYKFLTAFFLYAISTYILTYNNNVLTESLSISTIVICLFLLQMSAKKCSNLHLVLSGVFFSWAIFLRAYIAPLLIPITVYLYVKNNRKLNSNLLFKTFLFISSFVVIDGLWIIRNYKIYEKIIPLQSTPYKGQEIGDHLLLAGKFIKIQGEDWVSWNPGSMGQWFSKDEYLKKYNFTRPNDKIFHNRLFENTGITIDSLRLARQLLWCADNNNLNLPLDSIRFCEKEASRLFAKFIVSYSNEHPIHSNIISRISLLKKFIFQPYTFYIPFSFDRVGFFLKGYKVFFLLFNNIIVLFGITILFFLFFTNKYFDFGISFIFSFLLVFILFYWALFRGNIEYRYFIFAYLSCIWLVSNHIDLLNYFKYKKLNKL